MKAKIYRLLARWCSRLPWWPSIEVTYMTPPNRDGEGGRRLALRQWYDEVPTLWVCTRTALRWAADTWYDGKRIERAAFLQYLRLPADFGGTTHEAVLAARDRDRRRIAALEARVEELEGMLLDAQAAAAAEGRPVVG